MPLITIPEKPDDSAEIQKKLFRETQTLLHELVKKKEKLSEIKEQISKMKALTKQNQDIKTEFYSLLNEKVKISEIKQSDIYITKLESEIEALKNSGKKDAKKDEPATGEKK